MSFYSENSWADGPEPNRNLFEATLAGKDPLSFGAKFGSASPGNPAQTSQITPPENSPWNLSNGNEPYNAMKDEGGLRYTTGSVSSMSSAHAGSQLGAMSGSPEFTEKASGTWAKKARGKLLNERELALMHTEDSFLNEEELAIKKKAQNRLAQRAFRERKETKLKELELMLLQSEEERQKLLEKLNEIKHQFNTLQSENQRLRWNHGSSGSSTAVGGDSSNFLFPESQKDFVEEMVRDKPHDMSRAQVNKVYDLPQAPGRKVLGVGALWDYLLIKMEEEQFENVDMMEVMQLLKGAEVCHGFGPAYPLEVVDNALLCVVDRTLGGK